ncbi:hypothetical protein FJ567_25305 [Mesorhizobium sp. B2-4-16]|nr:hypothetical protein FJ567_25305 [Mesorhizobium sp. B2-4-16]TPL60861.1 hypothetical protein FJ956_27310 [Mesorhizobium sp. B2-4-3]
MVMSAGQRPPLSCRTSPPQGGRLHVTPAVANSQPWQNGEAHELLISPLVGEMPGRAEGARRIAATASLLALSPPAGLPSRAGRRRGRSGWRGRRRGRCLPA